MEKLVLKPLGPPGRADRKALAFHGEIVRLRACGYTLEAIREALADVGIEVSLATVSREIRHKGARARAVAGVEAIPTPLNGTAHMPPAWPPLHHVPTNAQTLQSDPPAARPAFPQQPAAHSGRELAEAFMKTIVTNPLLRSRSNR